MGRVPELPAGQPKWVLHSSISITLLPNEKCGLNLSADRSVSQLIILLGPEVVISCSWKYFPEYFLDMLKRRNELKRYNNFDWGCTIEDDSCLVIFNCCCYGCLTQKKKPRHLWSVVWGEPRSRRTQATAQLLRASHLCRRESSAEPDLQEE